MPPAKLPETVVLSLGGSVFRTGAGDAEYLRKLATLLRALAAKTRLVITTGGGRTAREYIELGRELGLTDVELDEIGIDVTRVHARLLAALLGPPVPPVPAVSLAEAVRESHRGTTVVLGGTEPGHTTDGVAALLATRLRAVRLVNATSVSGLFDRDPRKDPKAIRIDRIGWEEFRARLVRVGRGTPGQEFVFDQLGAELLARARIPIYIVDGRDLGELESALLGRAFQGTRVE
ncbi:MAG: UMP kinase [Thermoplasmata archaeon]|nr:UMP kinase [Thermoplasmata archaeon]